MIFDEAANHPRVLEINPRFWGSLLGSILAGINFPYLACLAGMDEAFPELNYEHKIYLLPQTAHKLAMRGLLPGRRDNLPIRGTGIQYWLADPLPEIFKVIYNVFTRLFGRENV
jgi:hypothetical protein